MNPKFGVRIQFWIAECHILFWGHFDLELDMVSVLENCVQSISPILSKVAIYFAVPEHHILFMSHCDLDLWPQF